MHISKRDELLDTPGGNPPPLTWHDYRNQELKDAFAELKRRRATLKKREDDKIIPRLTRRHWRFWLPKAIPTLPLAVAALMGKPWGLIGLTITWLALIVIYDVVLPRLARRRFRALNSSIYRGNFGYAVMYEGEPVWELLETALQHFGIELRMLLRNPELHKQVTPVIADMLTETWFTRCKLNELSPLDLYASPAMVGLADAAATAAATIHAIYTSYRAQPV